jgi:hypothetical protein
MLHEQGFATSVPDYWALGDAARLRIILGQQVDCPAVETGIDQATKAFLRMAWNRREPLRLLLNGLLSRSD